MRGRFFDGVPTTDPEKDVSLSDFPTIDATMTRLHCPLLHLSFQNLCMLHSSFCVCHSSRMSMARASVMMEAGGLDLPRQASDFAFRDMGALQVHMQFDLGDSKPRFVQPSWNLFLDQSTPPLPPPPIPTRSAKTKLVVL